MSALHIIECQNDTIILSHTEGKSFGRLITSSGAIKLTSAELIKLSEAASNVAIEVQK